MPKPQKFLHHPIWTALFNEDGSPRARWIHTTERRVYASTRRRVPDAAEQIFDVLSHRYVERAQAGTLPADVPLEAFLATRFSRDAGREAASLLGRSTEPLEYEDGDPIAELVDPDDPMLDPDWLPDDGRLAARVDELLEEGLLGPAERQAFVARRACDFSATRTHEQEDLHGRERNAHNNAFAVACRKLGVALRSEEYLA